VEVEAMSRTLSPSTQKPYGVARVTAVWSLARSTYYAARHRREHPRVPKKRGPQRLSDEELAGEIRQVIQESVFHGEGYRKIWARLRHRDIRVWKERVLRIMREQQLLSPSRQPVARAENPHAGTIVVDAPNQLWGTDATATFTAQDGQVTIFAAIDHCTAECLGIHAVKRAHRFEALEPIRQAVSEQFGSFSAGVAAGVRLRHDHGSVYMSEDFQNEIRFLGMESSPAFVRQPEGNGCIERFFRTLKEQLLWLHTSATLQDLRQALSDFRQRYNQHWILERIGYRSPAQARADFSLALAQAA
jgi:transposase InsO family protein